MEASAQSNQQPGSGNNKRKRRPAGTPDPDAEVVSLSPKTLMESDRYICEICNQGFQRDQNLQMHRRRHKVPWKLLKRVIPEVRKRVYVCPEPSCLHHDPCHALGDLVGIKKHYRRKHSTEKHWKCSKCSKGYAVQSDYKAHLKTCGTRGHSCACGRVFSRVESFIEHQDTCSVAREKATETDASSGLHFLRLGIAMPQNSRNASIVFPNQLNRYISDPSVCSGWSVEQQHRELQLMPMIRVDARKSSLVRVEKGAREEVSYRSTSNGIEELQLSIGLPLNGVDYTDTTTTDLRLSSPCLEGDVYSGAKLENHDHLAMLRYIQECRLLQTNDRDTQRFYSTLGEEEPETELSLGRGGCVSRFKTKKQRISGECYTVSISDSIHVSDT